MPSRLKITNALNAVLISMSVYSLTYYANFNPANEFEKWAAIELSDFNEVPHEMEIVVLESGLYTVFHYKGSSADTCIFQYIFSTQLPKSKYQLDNRPHFEVLGENYKNNDPNSEEEIWIPIKDK